MNKLFKRFLSVALGLIMIIAYVPMGAVAAFSAELIKEKPYESKVTFSEVLDSGTFGDGILWEYDGSTLRLTGDGVIPYWDNPWYRYCSTITSLILNGNFTEIGDGIFRSLAITSVYVPNSVVRIGHSAFLDCEKLENVSLGSGLREFNMRVFDNCTSLLNIEFHDENNNFNLIDGVLYDSYMTLLVYPAAKADTEYTVAANCNYIVGYAFSGTAELKTVNLPDNMHAFDCNAFCASSVENINVSNENYSFTSTDGIVYSKSGNVLVCYPAGKTAESFTLPAGIDYF